MVGSDPIESIGVVGGESGSDVGGGWALVVEHDGAAALIDTVLELDPAETYTKTELSDAAGVAYKTLYLDGTVEALVEADLLESEERDGEETQFRIATDSSVFAAAAAFDEAVGDEA